MKMMETNFKKICLAMSYQTVKILKTKKLLVPVQPVCLFSLAAECYDN